jgi:hypothetical protein
MRRLRITAALFTALVIAGCTSSSGVERSLTTLPSAEEDQLVATTASFDVAVGENQRVLVGLLTGDHRDVGLGSVDMRFSFQSDGQTAQQGEFGEWTQGKFLALPTEGEVPTADKPRLVEVDSGRGVYEATESFDQAGFYQIEVRADVEGLGERTVTTSLEVHDEPQFPSVGDEAPATDTLTLDSDVESVAIDSRAQGDVEVPDRQLHDTSLADAIEAGRPAVVGFATPVFCASRFCGPTVDLLSEIDTDHGEAVDVIHQEVWKDFEAEEPNDVVEEWLVRNQNLPEPWVFLVGADGLIKARWDNVVTKDQIEAELAKL